MFYFLEKDYPFVDGRKRIAATIFLEFLIRSKLLVKNMKSNNFSGALVAITLLTTESNPEEIEIINKIIVNLISK